jgi:hypothetical protein
MISEIEQHCCNKQIDILGLRLYNVSMQGRSKAPEMGISAHSSGRTDRMIVVKHMGIK